MRIEDWEDVVRKKTRDKSGEVWKRSKKNNFKIVYKPFAIGRKFYLYQRYADPEDENVQDWILFDTFDGAGQAETYLKYALDEPTRISYLERTAF